jgi:hypothetical protein
VASFWIKLCRGAEATNNLETGKTLHNKCLKFISSKFKVEPSAISSDFDAYSVVITVSEMSDTRKQAMRDFLLSFGTEITLRCGLPHKATGSTKQDSIFGCSGNKCLHLPKGLQGKEVLVIDTPVKVALHISCKTSLINSLNASGTHLTPSNSSGVCFNSQQASNKPSYVTMVESILNSCFVKELNSHVVHVADFGFRLPIKPGSANCPLNVLFTKMKRMSDLGINVELIQLDVAFSVPVGANRLVQFSCHRYPSKKRKRSLLRHSTVKMYPLHQLPRPGGKPILDNKVKGTVSLKKNIKSWDKEKPPVNIGNTDADDWLEEEDADRETVCLLYQHQDNSEKVVQHLCTRWNMVYSVKIYSTIAHLLLQSRARFPLTEKSMFSLGERTIAQLQSLLKHTDFVSKMSFKIVKDTGFLSRTEFSIRPHQKDSLRTRGHYNDFLLHVCLSAHDLCMGGEYEVKVNYIDSQMTQTKVMTLTSEALAYLKFTASIRFNRIYANPRATAWLQAHLSLLLITAGFAPEYRTKHLNNWLRDQDRMDPYERSSTLENPITKWSDPQPVHASLPVRTKSRLSRFFFKDLHFSRNGVNILHEFMGSYTTSDLNPMPSYEQFSLLDKLQLSVHMWTDIIPFLSQFMAKKVRKKDKKDVMRHSSLTQDPKEHFGDDTWWLTLGPNDAFTQHHMEKTQIPKDPVSRSIHALLHLGTFSDLHRPMFTILLFQFILRCHSDEIHLPRGRGKVPLKLQPLEQSPKRLLEKHGKGGATITTKDLHQLCTLLQVPARGTNRKKDYYLQALCKTFHFPCACVDFQLRDIKRHSSESKKINSILNDVLASDVVTQQPSTDSTANRFYRNIDNSTISIIALSRVAQKTQPQMIPSLTSKSGYKLLALCVNTSESQCEDNLRKFMHDKMSQISRVHNKFLTSHGLSNTMFRGAQSLEELETSHEFQILMTGQVTTIPKSMKFIPEIILPMVSLVYAMDITFYNKQKKKTHIYVHHQSRSITYTLDGLHVTPLIKCLILSFELNGEYSRNEPLLRAVPIRVRYNELSTRAYSGFVPGTFGGRRTPGTNARTILPDLKVTKNQPFLESMCKVMSELGSARQAHDLLALLSFVEELSSCATHFTGFSRNVTEQNSDLTLPLPTLVRMLRTTDSSKLCHKILCPFYCLKFKMLIGVLVLENKRKHTLFYGFNSRTKQVDCEKVTKYNVLDDRGHAIYFYATNTNTGFYTPREGHPARNLFRYKTLSTKYSHLSDTCLMEILAMFKEAHGIELLKEQELQDQSLRPHHKTAIMHTHVTSAISRGTTNTELLQMGKKHHALMLIFPHYNNRWEACIVHHPLQEESAAKSTLASFITHSSVAGEYNQHCIRGMSPVDCESAFYVILYTVIGHRTSSWKHFENSMQKLSTEEDLSHKVRLFVCNVVNGQTEKNFVPNWLEQMMQVHSATS